MSSSAPPSTSNTVRTSEGRGERAEFGLPAPGDVDTTPLRASNDEPVDLFHEPFIVLRWRLAGAVRAQSRVGAGSTASTTPLAESAESLANSLVFYRRRQHDASHGKGMGALLTLLPCFSGLCHCRRPLASEQKL